MSEITVYAIVGLGVAVAFAVVVIKGGFGTSVPYPSMSGKDLERRFREEIER